MIFKIPTLSPISLLVCDSRPDAVLVTSLADQIGWRVALWYYLLASLEQPQVADFEHIKEVKAEQVNVGYPIKFDAAVMVTHSLENDSYYLKQQLLTDISHIGLFGPVSLNIGGRIRQAIVSFILAKMQQQLTKYKAVSFEKLNIIFLKAEP